MEPHQAAHPRVRLNAMTEQQDPSELEDACRIIGTIIRLELHEPDKVHEFIRSETARLTADINRGRDLLAVFAESRRAFTDRLKSLKEVHELLNREYAARKDADRSAYCDA